MGGLLATTPSLPRPLRPGHQPLPVWTAGVGSALSPRPFSPGRSLCGPPLSASEQHCGARGARGLLAPSCGPWHRARQEVVEGAAARANPPDTRGPASLLGLCPRGHLPQGARRGWVPSVPRATPTGPSPVLSSCYSSERRPLARAGPAAPAAPDRVCPAPAADPAPAAASRGPGLQWAAARTGWTLPTPPRSHRPPPRPARRRPAQVSSLQKSLCPFWVTSKRTAWLSRPHFPAQSAAPGSWRQRQTHGKGCRGARGARRQHRGEGADRPRARGSPPCRCRRRNAGPGRVPRPFCVLEKPWRRKASDQEPEGLAEKRELHGLDLGDRLAGSEEQVQEIPRRCERRCSAHHAGREARTPS